MGTLLTVSELPNYYAARRLIQLADGVAAEGFGPPSTLAPATEAKMEAAIGDAEQEVRGLLRGKYEIGALPAADLKRIVAEIAIWFLFGLKSEFRNAFDSKYKKHRERLEAIRDGEDQLGGVTVATSVDLVRTSADDATAEPMKFGQGGLRQF